MAVVVSAQLCPRCVEPTVVVCRACLSGQVPLVALLHDFRVECTSENHNGWCYLLKQNLFRLSIEAAAQWVYQNQRTLLRRPKLLDELGYIFTQTELSKRADAAAIFWPLLPDLWKKGVLPHFSRLDNVNEKILCDGHGALKRLRPISMDNLLYNHMMSFTYTTMPLTIHTEQLNTLRHTCSFLYFLTEECLRELPSVAQYIIIRFACGVILLGSGRIQQNCSRFSLLNGESHTPSSASNGSS